MRKIPDSEVEKAIDTFGRDVVIHSDDSATDTAISYIEKSVAEGISSDEARTAAKKIAQNAAKIAAREAMRAFFSNHQLVGSFSIKIRVNDDCEIDLADEFGAPLSVAMFDDEWPARYSRYF